MNNFLNNLNNQIKKEINHKQKMSNNKNENNVKESHNLSTKNDIKQIPKNQIKKKKKINKNP